MSSFTQSKDVIEGPKYKNGSLVADYQIWSLYLHSPPVRNLEQATQNIEYWVIFGS